MKLGHVDIQRLARAGFRRDESDALDSSQRLHGTQYLCFVCWKEVSGSSPFFETSFSGTSPSICVTPGVVFKTAEIYF